MLKDKILFVAELKIAAEAFINDRWEIHEFARQIDVMGGFKDKIYFVFVIAAESFRDNHII